MEHFSAAGARRRYITMLSARSASKVQPSHSHPIPTARLLNTLRPTPETPSSAPNCPVRQAGTTKFGLQQRQTCRRGTHIPYTISTPHSQLHFCLFLVYLINPCNSPCPLHRPSLSFSIGPYCCCCYSTRLVTLFKLVQAQSPRRLPVLIAVPLRHNNLFSFLSAPFSQPKHSFSPCNANTFFHEKPPLSAPAAD